MFRGDGQQGVGVSGRVKKLEGGQLTLAREVEVSMGMGMDVDASVWLGGRAAGIVSESRVSGRLLGRASSSKQQARKVQNKRSAWLMITSACEVSRPPVALAPAENWPMAGHICSETSHSSPAGLMRARQKYPLASVSVPQPLGLTELSLSFSAGFEWRCCLLPPAGGRINGEEREGRSTYRLKRRLSRVSVLARTQC